MLPSLFLAAAVAVSGTSAVAPVRSHVGAPVVVAVGDVAAEGGAQADTASVAASLRPDHVVALGDLVYPNGTLDEFRRLWQPTWGRFDDILLPVPGNHEYVTAGAAGYRAYLGVTGRTWWSRRVGTWTVIGLDSERSWSVAQMAFLQRRLARHDGRPTVVAWHRARFSSGGHGDDAWVDPLWSAVATDPDVRIVLWGHDHDYEHLAVPVAGRDRKLHAFVVGTGGVALRDMGAVSPYSTTRIADRHGVLRLRLGALRWRWSFVATDGSRLDGGRRRVAPQG